MGILDINILLWGFVHDDDRVQSSCVSEFHVVPGVGVNLEDAKAFVRRSLHPSRLYSGVFICTMLMSVRSG